MTILRLWAYLFGATLLSLSSTSPGFSLPDISPVSSWAWRATSISRPPAPPTVNSPIQQLALVRPSPHTRRRKNGINSAFSRSMKKADTSGRIRKARGEGPKRSVTAVIVAMAVGVEPRVKPLKPAAITAAS